MRGAGPLVAAFLGFVLLGFIVQTARFALLAWVGQQAMLDLRMQVFSHLMKRSTHFFHRNPVGRLMTRVISDVQNLNEMFSSGFVAIVGDALSLTAIVVWMFSKHVGLALVAVGIMPLLLVSTEVFRRYASAAYRETQGRYAAIQAFLQEQLSGMALVQMNARERPSRRLFRDFNQKYLDAFLRTIFAYAVFFPVVEFITNGTLAALIFYAGFKLQAGHPHPGPAAGLHPAVRAVLPADPGTGRALQRHADRPGLQRAHLQAAGQHRPDPGAGRAPCRRLPARDPPGGGQLRLRAGRASGGARACRG